MATEVRMPKLSPTMETGTLNRWVKHEGASVASGDTLAEVETDKANMPLESFEDGKLLKIVAGEGATVKVDEVVAIIGQEGEDISALLAGAAPAAPAALARPRTESQQARAITETEEPRAEARPSIPAESAPAPAEKSAAEGRVKASPLARKLAKERGIDLSAIKPSGPGGRILERDVPEKAATAPVARPAALPGGGEEDIPLSNLRQTIARRMLQSKQTVPHFYLHMESRADRLVRLREKLNQQAQDDSQKISLNDLIVKIAALALARHPEVNVSFNETSIRRHGDVNIAVAVATPEGLYVPVLHNVDRLGLAQISAGIKDLAQKARQKRLKADELTGSGFTITNLGMFGIDHFFAIVNPPEAAILAVGAVQDRPVVDKRGRVVAGKTMGLTLSCDHRAVDGAQGARFLATMKDLLENPLKLLL